MDLDKQDHVTGLGVQQNTKNKNNLLQQLRNHFSHVIL